MTGYDVATYWAPGAIQNDGTKALLDPVEIKVRWEDVKIDFVDREGKVVTSKARIFTLEETEFGGILWHGSLVDATNIDPLENDGAREIRQITKQYNLKNEVVLYTIMV